MFDDLHDPNPPSPDSEHFAAVAARARRMRVRRWTTTTTAAMVIFAMGVGVVVARDDDRIRTERPATTTTTTEPSEATTSTTPDRPDVGACLGIPDGLALTGTIGAQMVSIDNHGSGQISGVADLGIQLGLRTAPGESVTRVLEMLSPMVESYRSRPGSTDDTGELRVEGLVWAELGARHERRIVRIDAQGEVTEVASGDVRLADAGLIDGEPVATYIDYGGSNDEPESEFSPTGDVWLVNGTGPPDPTLLDEAPETGRSAVSAHIGGDLVAVSELLDPDARFRYLTPSGDEVSDVSSPTDRGPNQNSGVIARSAIIAPDRSTVAWVEAEPLPNGTGLGPWSLVVADGADATERLTLPVGERGESLIHADYDGRYWVGNFGTMPMDAGIAADKDPDRSVVVDTQAERPRPINLGCGDPMLFRIDRSTSGSQPGGTGTTTTTTPAPPETTAPPADPAAIECPALPDGLALTAAEGGRAWSVTNSGAEQLYSARSAIGVARVLRGEDGTVWVSEGEGLMTRIRRITPDGEVHESESVNSDATGGLYLSHAGTIDGRTVATYIDSYGGEDSEEYGDVWLEYANGERTSLGPAGMIEYGVESAAPAGTVVVLGAWSDLGELFDYVDASGERVDGGWFNPSNDSSLYAQPPRFESPMLSPDRSRLAWIEGPESSPVNPRPVGEWELVVAESGPEDELLRVQVGGNDETLVAADYDGRYWVGTFGDRPDAPTVPAVAAEPTRAVVVDTQAGNPQPIDLGCAPAAEVMIDRAASSDAETDGGGGPPPSTSPEPDCTVDPQAPEITENVGSVPAPQQIPDVQWAYGGDSNYDRCAALTYARLDVAGATGSSPVQLMLFNEGEYIGTATDCAFGFTSVTATTADSVTVRYRWPRDGDPNAAPSGSATVTYRWSGGSVITEGQLPAELLRLSNCGS